MNLFASDRPARRRLVSALCVAALVPFLTAADDARPAPARLVPAQGLGLYLEYDGVEAHAEAWNATACYSVFRGTPAGEALLSVARQVVDHLLAQVPDIKLTSAHLTGALGQLTRRGFVLAFYEQDECEPEALVAVLPGLGQGGGREPFDRLMRLVPDAVVSKPVPVRGREVLKLLGANDKEDAASGMVWWLEGNDLVVVLGGPFLGKVEGDARKPDFLATLFDAIEGKVPNALTNSDREAAVAEGRDLAGFEPNGLFFVHSKVAGTVLAEMLGGLVPIAQNAAPPQPMPAVRGEAPLPPAPLEVEEAQPTNDVWGLSGIKRVVGRWGFQGKALLTDIRVEMPAPRAGLLGALLDQPGFRTDRLPPVPREAREVIAGSFRPGATYDRVITLIKTLAPDTVVELDMALKALDQVVRDATGERLREDLLAHIGPTWCAFTTPFTWDKTEYPMPTLVVEVDDAKAFGKVLDALATRANEALRAAPGMPGACAAPSLVLERLPEPERGYRLTSPEGVVPWLSDDLRPTVILGKNSLVLAINPVLARAAIAAESRPDARWQPGNEVARTLAAFPAKVTSLSVGDPRDSAWPEAIATLPRLSQYLGNLLLGGAGAMADAGGAAGVLDLLGVPRPGAFRIRLDPAKVPKAEQVRTQLFPSVLATVLDDHGLRLIGAEALPLGCIHADVSGKNGGKKIKIDLTNGFHVKVE